MKKLLAALIMGLGVYGIAFANDGYINQGEIDFSDVPAMNGEAYDGQDLNWLWGPSPESARHPHPERTIVSENRMEWSSSPD